jgi:hypothetical protein
MRIIIQPLSPGLELCAHLGLVLLPFANVGGKIVHVVLARSPCRSKLRPKDIIFAVNGTPIDRLRFLVFSDRRSSSLTLKIFEGDLFAVRDIRLRLGPDHYRPLDDLVQEARRVAQEQPPPGTVVYRNPRPSTVECWNPRFVVPLQRSRSA